MGAGSLKPHGVPINSVYQDPIGLDVAIPASREFTAERVILVLRRQRSTVDEEVKDSTEPTKIFSAALLPLDVSLELPA